ncbi:substrate-binding domain-containing protein [Victivallis sp.]|uniref:substrate-binding domain-containing protein n=1 Tax=Victivallis sp. TaxID=2049020 RepID=UPI003A949586
MMQRLKELRIPFELVSNQELEKSDGALAGFSGVIFHYATPPELTRRFATLPQIFIMKEDTNVTAVDIYKPNELIAGKLAADYLIRQGFRELLLIWEKKWTYNPSEHMRLEGFRRQAGMHHIKVRELGYDQSESLEPFSNELLKNLEEVNRHAGIFAFNDQIAFTTCIILNMLGFERKKRELELISCDNTHLLRSLTPVPPAIDLHHGELARRAVDGLLWRIRNPNALPQEVLLFPELVERDSSGEECRSGVSASVDPAHFGVDCVTPKEK